jgi:hypothetical protein
LAPREAAGSGGEAIYRRTQRGGNRDDNAFDAERLRRDPDETVAEFHGAPPIVPAEFASDGRKALVIAAMAAHIAKRRAD